MTTTNEVYDESIIINSWEDLKLSDDILRGIYSYGFVSPSSIQQKAILPIKCGRDIIAQAQSGTGKTGAFTIGSLCRLNPDIKTTQILAMAPTRELAEQTSNVYRCLGTYIPNFSVKTFVGGTSVRDDINFLENTPPTVAVGCPGRIADLIKKRALPVDQIKILVIDEADEMLSQGFKDQVRNIFQMMPEDVQVAIFSATMNREVIEITSHFMRDPVKIIMEAEQLSLQGIAQHYVSLRSDDEKFDTLKDICSRMSISQCVIYCNSVNRVRQLHEAMLKDGFGVTCIHSGLSKSERDLAFNDFKTGNSKFLISSDITARGMDVQQVGLVINFDLTRDVHTYLHRIGRSGRWGRKGVAINFITQYDRRTMTDLEQYYRMQITPLPAI
jgi:translation initiation factor 4A